MFGHQLVSFPTFIVSQLKYNTVTCFSAWDESERNVYLILLWHGSRYKQSANTRI